MAGFVLADPRFSKNGTKPAAVASQSKAVEKAIQGGARVTPLYISPKRVKELELTLSAMKEVSRDSKKEIVYQANATGSQSMRFVLVQDDKCPSQGDGKTFRVCYHPSEEPQGPGPGGIRGRQDRFEFQFNPVYALTNPGANAANYKSALTGDYDLWGVYPQRADYDAAGQDQRMVPGSNYRAKPIRDFIAHEDEHIGNITPRINHIRGLLNAYIRGAGYGYPGGEMVHHSDELGRPLVEDVELEFIAFLPGQDGSARFIESLGNFQIFEMQARKGGYKDLYNPNWKAFHHFNGVLDQIEPGRGLSGQSSDYL